MLALAVLTKGLLALALAGLIMLSAIFFLPTKAGFKQLFAPLPLPLFVFVLIAAPWHIAAAWRDEDFLQYYFIHEHVLRFLGQRLPVDYYNGPWWYYLPRLWAFLFPLVDVFIAAYCVIHCIIYCADGI